MAREFKEVWFVDFEFRAQDGGNPEPRCMVAYELHTKTLKRLWFQGRICHEPPFDFSENSLYVAYYVSAEMGCHLALGWPCPVNLLDLFVEFRSLMNGMQPQGGFGLLGAMSFFGIGHMAPTEKESMRDLALREGDYTDTEKVALLDYCQGDVESLVRLYSKMIPKINIPTALMRGRYMAACADVERNGIPIDHELHGRLMEHWDEIKSELIQEVDQSYGVFDESTFKTSLFKDYLEKRFIRWPLLDSGALKMDEETFKFMSQRHP